MDILTKIKSQYKQFSKGQRLIADYILNHYEKSAYLTASALGIAVGVSESTVVRFAFELGFDGYPKFQQALQDIIKTKLTAVQRMSMAEMRIDKNDIIESVLNQDIAKIKLTCETVNRDDFKDAVSTILASEKIYILGARSSAALAQFLAFYLNLMFPGVVLLNSGATSELYEDLIHVNEKSVFISIGFPRYSMSTINASRYVRTKGTKVIAITDSYSSPLAEWAHYTLTARSDMTSFVDSLVAPLSMINSLLVALGIEKKDELTRIFEQLESIWAKNDVYEKVNDSHE